MTQYNGNLLLYFKSMYGKPNPFLPLKIDMEIHGDLSTKHMYLWQEIIIGQIEYCEI